MIIALYNNLDRHLDLATLLTVYEHRLAYKMVNFSWSFRASEIIKSNQSIAKNHRSKTRIITHTENINERFFYVIKLNIVKINSKVSNKGYEKHTIVK